MPQVHGHGAQLPPQSSAVLAQVSLLDDSLLVALVSLLGGGALEELLLRGVSLPLLAGMSLVVGASLVVGGSVVPSKLLDSPPPSEFELTGPGEVEPRPVVGELPPASKVVSTELLDCSPVSLMLASRIPASSSSLALALEVASELDESLVRGWVPAEEPSVGVSPTEASTTAASPLEPALEVLVSDWSAS